MGKETASPSETNFSSLKVIDNTNRQDSYILR